jgi:DNA-binding CsgD family transcriptional regulator
VVLKLQSTLSSANAHGVEPGGVRRWSVPHTAHKISISVGDAALAEALDAALVMRPEFIVVRDEEAEVIIADARLPESDFAGRGQVLVVGSGERRAGETAIDSLDPYLILSAAAVLASGYRLIQERPAPELIHLSAREREVAGLLVEGASNKLIARELDISVHTAKFHVTAVLDKLGARNRSDAVAIALREGLVTL